MSNESKEGRRVGRPSIGPQITLRLPPELLERVDTEAYVKDCTRAEMLRRLIEQALND